MVTGDTFFPHHPTPLDTPGAKRDNAVAHKASFIHCIHILSATVRKAIAPALRRHHGLGACDATSEHSRPSLPPPARTRRGERHPQRRIPLQHAQERAHRVPHLNCASHACATVPDGFAWQDTFGNAA